MTILLIVLFVMMLSGVGFFPSAGFTPQHRGIVSTVLIAFFLFWLLKYSAYHVW